MKEEWKDKLRGSLADYEEAVPEGLWDDIGRAMADHRHGMSRPMGDVEAKRSSAKLIVWRLVAAAACVACGVGIFMYVGGGKGKGDGVVASRTPASTAASAQAAAPAESGAPSESDAPANPAPATAGQPLLASGAVPVAVSPSAAREYSSSGSLYGASPEEAPAAAGSSTASGAEEAAAGEPSKGATPAADSQAEKPVVVVASARGYKAAASPRQASPSASRSGANEHQLMPASAPGGGFSASLYAANMASGAGSADDSRFVLASDGLLYSMLPQDDEAAGQPIKSYVTSGMAEEKTAKHHQPVRLGLSVRYAISDRWGVESGLAYSYLSSDMTSRTGDSRYATKQKVHFVGIPLAADYSLWRSRWLNVYVMAGGMVEKSVKATAATTSYMGDMVLSEDSKRLKMRQLQWSANAAAGIQLNVAKGVGVYAEPGLSYYFDNGSAIKTAYSDKPLNFSMKLGLRYSFER